MNPDDLTDEQIAEYAEQFEELPEKLILVELLAEVKAIRVALTDGTDAPTDGERDAATEYRCTRCPDGQTVPAAKRESHARSQHKVPPGDELSLFEAVE